MQPANLALLADRGIVRVAGADAKKLLQGLITNDMDLLGTKPAIHAALLSPQGKILFEFFVVGAGEAYLLETAAAQAANLSKRLTLYKLRAKVEISDQSANYAVFALWGAPPAAVPGSIAFSDPRLAQLGTRIIAPNAARAAVAAAPGTRPASAEDWHRHRIQLGVPEAERDYRLGDTFLHEANYDQLSGVSFSKGCFIGQEVASRMQHRGGGRKRIVVVAGTAPLPANAAIKAATVPLGSLGSVDGSRGLALVRLDRAAEALAAGTTITADAVPISLSKPAWAQFAMTPAPRTEAV
ncbi:MAG TPA: folate-binding protein [Hyphomicrobiaceae bacterium]|jgi:folate-binding protein YgfZ|nr:folate-binding protein [Hyphomicrobiaceae bacterium]